MNSFEGHVNEHFLQCLHFYSATKAVYEGEEGAVQDNESDRAINLFLNHSHCLTLFAYSAHFVSDRLDAL